MPEAIGARVRMLRQQRGWSQEQLAEHSGVDRRTIQRIEAREHEPSADTVAGLARAFGTELSKLRFGFTSETLAEFEEMYLCPHCNAPLEARTFVDHEQGDIEFEAFRCGHTRGWRYRPCPSDPSFPKWEDYDLSFFEEAGGGWLCVAGGTTDAARVVELASGVGQTREQAERMVRRSYVEVQDSPAAAEAMYPLFG